MGFAGPRPQGWRLKEKFCDTQREGTCLSGGHNFVPLPDLRDAIGIGDSIAGCLVASSTPLFQLRRKLPRTYLGDEN